MRYLYNVLFIFLTVSILACSTTETLVPETKKTVPETRIVGVVGGENITLGELINQYERNNLSSDKPDSVRNKELAEFLDLYLLYKAKLLEARENGIFDSDEILKELRQYEIQYAIPYWLENEILEKLIDEYLVRSKREINASHILIAIPEDASPADTSYAYGQLIEARNRFLNGEDFDVLSNEYSTISEGRSMGGPLGYFSTGWAIKPFEDVAFSTANGTVSMPFRTQFGYHILYVKDNRERKSDRFVSHIYFNARATDEAGVDSMRVLASNVYNQLRNGADWKTSVQQFTQDQRSAEYDGQIGWINYGAYDNSFTDIVFGVDQDNIGKPLPPVETVYGIHVLKVDSVRTFTNIQQERDEALATIKSQPNFRDQRSLVLNEVRKRVGEATNKDAYNLFTSLREGRDSTKVSETVLSEDILSRDLYKIGDNVYTIENFISFIVENSPLMVWSGTGDLLFEAFSNAKVEEELLRITNREYPDYRNTITNYHEGLAVFKLTEEYVWNYARFDSTRLREMFDQNPSNYVFPTRYNIVRISAKDDSILVSVKQKISQGIELDSLRNTVEDLILINEIVSDLTNEPFNYLKNVSDGTFSEVFDFRNSKNMLYLDKILKPVSMTFDEAYFRLVSEYQPVREMEWNALLREKYSIKGFQENLK
jgi:peptidyl-prolyl cis-trans isomerase SurA